MGKKILGSILAMVLGVAAGIVTSFCVIPMPLDGHWILVDRRDFQGRNQPASGERIIVETMVFTDQGNGGRLARRVAAVEGDRIQIREGRLRINGEDAMDLWPGISEFPEDMTTVIVEEDHVFVLCDHQESTLDSRSEVIGQVALEEIWGRVVYE